MQAREDAWRAFPSVHDDSMEVHYFSEPAETRKNNRVGVEKRKEKEEGNGKEFVRTARSNQCMRAGREGGRGIQKRFAHLPIGDRESLEGGKEGEPCRWCVPDADTPVLRRSSGRQSLGTSATTTARTAIRVPPVPPGPQCAHSQHDTAVCGREALASPAR